MGQSQEKLATDEGDTTRGGEGDIPLKKHKRKHRGKKKHKGKKSHDPILTPPKIEITEPDVEPRTIVTVEAKKPLSPKQEKLETDIDDVEPPQTFVDVADDSEKENVTVTRTPITEQIRSEHIHEFSQTPAKGKMPKPAATSTPAINGDIHAPMTDGESESEESESEESSSEDEDKREDSRGDSLPDYSKFYKSSYLRDSCQNYMKRASQNAGQSPSVKNFARPENFTYVKESPSWSKTSGMMAMASGKGVKVVKVRSSSPIQPDLKNSEVLRMSMYPAAKPPAPNEVIKIEREDWPGPPSPAALLPELLRERKAKRGEPLYDEEENDMSPREDPKVMKEIDELSKFQEKSSITQAILKQLLERKMVIPMPLDPWKASRAPSADYEPKMQTRHLSPMFASPSRFVDRPRPRSWDDNDIGYRSLCIPHYNKYRDAKPGYGRWNKASTLPLSGQYGGHLDFSYFELEEQEQQKAKEKSAHTSTSTVNTESSSKREMPSSIFDGTGPSALLLRIQQTSWHTATMPEVYDYERLKITNFDLPKDVDRNTLEIHLSKEDFEDLFHMTREEFYKLAEWKRNDMKRRLHLY